MIHDATPAETDGGDRIVTATNVLRDVDMNSYWNDLPKGTKQYVLASDQEVIPSLIGIAEYFNIDKEYDWQLRKALKSIHILAVELLVKGNDNKAIVMIFYGNLVREFLMRGFDAVKRLLDCMWKLKAGYRRSGLVLVEIDCHQFFTQFSHLHRAAATTQSRKTMANFLRVELGRSPDPDANCWLRRLQVKSEYFGSTPAYSIDTCNAIPKAIIEIKIIFDQNTTRVIPAYEDTTLTWIFNHCFAAGNLKLLKGTRRVPHRQGLCLVNNVNKEHVFYLASSGNKTLRELGIEHDDVFSINKVLEIPVSTNCTWEFIEIKENTNSYEIIIGEHTNPPRRSGKSKSKRNKKTRRKRREKCQVRPPGQDDLDLDALRECHSRSMEPIFDELRPLLESIRGKLNVSVLQRTLPKDRRPSKRGAARENVVVASVSNLPTAKDTVLRKAGKAVHPILVGEATHLFNTRQLRSSKMVRVITLDLHGCSRYSALNILTKRLYEWVDEAMSGEYPFVIPVDVICGGGNQVLSEIVAQFVCDNRQVANRPKGLF